MAERQGMVLRKSRRRDPQALDYGMYVLIDARVGKRHPGTQPPVASFPGDRGMTLDDVERYLTRGAA